MALSETQKAVLSRLTVEQRTRVDSDTYAASRCKCRHFVYPGQKPGDPCLFCACTEHRAPAATAQPSPKGRQ